MAYIEVHKTVYGVLESYVLYEVKKLKNPRGGSTRGSAKAGRHSATTTYTRANKCLRIDTKRIISRGWRSSCRRTILSILVVTIYFKVILYSFS